MNGRKMKIIDNRTRERDRKRQKERKRGRGREGGKAQHILPGLPEQISFDQAASL